VTRGDELPGLGLLEDANIRSWFRAKDMTRTISPTPPAIEISTAGEIIMTFPHARLFSHDGYSLEVNVKPPSLIFGGLSAPPPWGSPSSFIIDMLIKFGSPPNPARVLHVAWRLHSRKASGFVHGRRYGVVLSVKVGLSLLGLYL